MHNPFEEAFYEILIKGHIALGQHNKAISVYENVTELFYKELGVSVSDTIRKLYKDITKSINNIELDLDIIKKDLMEPYDVKGAFRCNYEIFKSIYQLEARSIVRTGRSIHIALITISDYKGEVPDAETLKPAMDELFDSIVYNLRKNDVVSRYSATQLIVMLPITTFESGEKVLVRLIDKFKKYYRKSKININTKLNIISPIDLQE